MGSIVSIVVFGLCLTCSIRGEVLSQVPVSRKLRLLFQIEGSDADSTRLRLAGLLGKNGLNEMDASGKDGEDIYRIWILSTQFDRVYEMRFFQGAARVTRVTKFRSDEVARTEGLIVSDEAGKKLHRLIRAEVTDPIPLWEREPKMFYSSSRGTVIEGVQDGSPVWAIRKRAWHDHDVYQQWLMLVRTIEELPRAR